MWREAVAKIHILPQEAPQKWRRLHPNVTKRENRSNFLVPLPSSDPHAEPPATRLPPQAGGDRRQESHCGLGDPEAAGGAWETGQAKAWSGGPGSTTFILGHGGDGGLAVSPTSFRVAAAGGEMIPLRDYRGDTMGHAS